MKLCKLYVNPEPEHLEPWKALDTIHFNSLFEFPTFYTFGEHLFSGNPKVWKGTPNKLPVHDGLKVNHPRSNFENPSQCHF